MFKGRTQTGTLYQGHAAGPATPSPRNALCPCGSGKKTKRCHPRFVPVESVLEPKKPDPKPANV